MAKYWYVDLFWELDSNGDFHGFQLVEDNRDELALQRNANPTTLKYIKTYKLEKPNYGYSRNIHELTMFLKSTLAYHNEDTSKWSSNYIEGK
jgi:hypothetical protein